MLLLYQAGLVAQNAPITTISTMGNVIPGQVDVPITVTDFNAIGAISLTFEYAYAGLHFVQGTPNPLLDGFAIGDQNLGNGKHRVTMGWFGSGISLPNGTVIMTITFTFINGITPLEFYDSGSSCEYADADYNVLNDVPQSVYYINGAVCGSVENPGPVTGNTSVCQGQTGVGYSVSPVNNATGYIWTLPSGATIISGNNTNSISVDFSPTAVSGIITVCGLNICGNGPVSQLPVSVNPLPIANAGSNVTIPYGTNTTLHAASGGSGAFNYHWSPESLLINPNLQNPQTVNLTLTTVFTLEVTNQASLCKNTDDVIVSISGGPLNANPISVPALVCRGTTAQLFANPGGGSGSYTYSWSCTPPGSPPWTSSQANPFVSPDSTKVYHLSLADGFNTVQGSTSLTVFQLPTATIQGGDTLCGEGLSTVLTVDLTGTPPWSFYYSNGITTWFVPAQNTSPYLIVATEHGNYTILAVSDVNCTGIASGTAVVGIFPIPPAPVLSVFGSDIFSSGCCGNQWYKEGVLIPGATGSVFRPLVTAHYYDIVTVNGCTSDTSNIIYYFMTGIGLAGTDNFSVEPNPASNVVTVKSKSGISVITEISVISISGKKVATCSYNPLTVENEPMISIGHLPPGLYFLTIRTTSDVAVVKLIVQ
jgi:hypothetical protein